MKLRQHCPLLFPFPNPTSPSIGLEYHFQSYCSTGCFLLNPTPMVLVRQLPALPLGWWSLNQPSLPELSLNISWRALLTYQDTKGSTCLSPFKFLPVLTPVTRQRLLKSAQLLHIKELLHHCPNLDHIAVLQEPHSGIHKQKLTKLPFLTWSQTHSTTISLEIFLQLQLCEEQSSRCNYLKSEAAG